jgi:hypothetical protein
MYVEPNYADAFVFAHERCAVIRSRAFALTLSRLGPAAPIPADTALTPLTREAMEAFEMQWRGEHWTRQGGWPWPRLAQRFTRKPRSFHVALWSGPYLCGLCVGRVSKGRKHLTLHYMESAPDREHPLRGLVTPLMFEAARNYGVAMGVEKLRLRNPLPGLLERYRYFGFTLVRDTRGSLYFERDLG